MGEKAKTGFIFGIIGICISGLIIIEVILATFLFSYGTSALKQQENESAADVFAVLQPIEQLKAQIEDKYDIEIVLHADSIEGIDSFKCEVLTEEKVINKGLLFIDEQLSRYPEGFFTQLRPHEDIPFRFFLIGPITNELTESGIAGVSTAINGSIYLDLQERNWHYNWGGEPFLPKGDQVTTHVTNLEYIIHHEIGHAVDYVTRMKIYNWRIQSFEVNSIQPAFDREAWSLLLPPSFEYDDSSGQVSGKYIFRQNSSLEDIYFCDIYSTTNLAENLASLFGYAMCGHTPEAFRSPAIQAQLRYFFSVIKEEFDSESWTDTLYWERVLL
jgi:hypothetical protein